MIKVKDVMRTGVITSEPSVTVSRITKIMSNNNIGSVVLVQKNKAVGIITSEDIVALVAKGRNPASVKAREFTKRDFVTATPGDDIIKVAKIMVKQGVKRIPVIANGKIEGILTDKELLATAPEMLDVLSEKLKARAERVVSMHDVISGICENCEGYSDNLHNSNGRWLCEDCS